jgi:uncharacterized protein YggT (Ycf19 family)
MVAKELGKIYVRTDGGRLHVEFLIPGDLRDLFGVAPKKIMTDHAMSLILYSMGLLLRIYAAGLLVHTLLATFNPPNAQKIRQYSIRARRWLDPLYLPLLNPLRSVLKPVRVGSRAVDLAPLAILIGIKEINEALVFLIAGIK